MLDILRQNIDITHLSNFNTLAIAKYFFEINDENDMSNLMLVLDFAKNNNLKVLFVWWWTNLLFWFDKYDWIIIKNNLHWWNYDINNKILTSYSSENISDISKSLENNYGQNLRHRFIWLPWSIWWAIYWNAWCFWLETENNFLDAIVYNMSTKKNEVLIKKQMNFTYRSSLLKDTWKYFLIKARFDLSKKIEKYSSDVDNIYFRENKQPKWNTCWSFFKNPSRELSAWSLIEKVWLKWFKMWTAFFSSLHANFLMSDDNWNHKDLIELIKLAQQKVEKEYSIKLIPEVRIITN